MLTFNSNMLIFGLMITTQRIEKRGLGEYAYEITPAYDPRIQNTRYKKKYLGRVSGYDSEGHAIISRKWYKQTGIKTVLPVKDIFDEMFVAEVPTPSQPVLPVFKKKILETLLESDTPKPIASIQQYLSALLSNSTYTIDVTKYDPPTATSITGQYIYYTEQSRDFYYELTIPLSTSGQLSIYIGKLRIERFLLGEPVKVFITDNAKNIDNLNRLTSIVIRSSPYKAEKGIPLHEKFIYTSRSINFTQRHEVSIYMVQIFHALIRLNERHPDFNMSVFYGMRFTMTTIYNLSMKQANLSKYLQQILDELTPV